MNMQEFAKEILPVVQGAANGKDVQFRGRHETGEWLVRRSSDPTMYFVDDCEYRIKPEPKLRPYTREEWEKVLRVRNKVTNATLLVKEIGDHYVVIGEATVLLTFHEAMVRYVNLDGSPCGMIEEA